MPLTSQVIELVRQVRKTVECIAANYHNGGKWSNFNDLAGYCGIASRFLCSLASQHTINMELVCGLFDDDTHCWIEYDGYCIDLTISQFPPYDVPYKICRVGDRFYNEHYEPEMRGDSAVLYQKQWDHEQAFELYVDNLNEIYNHLFGGE